MSIYPYSSCFYQSADTAGSSQVKKAKLIDLKKENNKIVVQKKRTNYVTNTQLSNDLVNVKSQLILNKYINLAKDCQPPQGDATDTTADNYSSPIHNDERWMDVPRKKRRRPIVTGKNNEMVSRVKGVPKTIALHVYRVSPNTSPKDLQEHLQDNFPEVECESIASKHPHVYSSFKVTIFESHFRKAMDPELWPYGSCIQRFFEVVKKPPVIK